MPTISACWSMTMVSFWICCSVLGRVNPCFLNCEILTVRRYSKTTIARTRSMAAVKLGQNLSRSARSASVL
ncbi:hypothetical protein C8Q72DRAFT_853016 [Fomitopsis betulina]|nr:hypothetical protein C8Q72DRAFT_853016 [Fomitopsis betulina]